MDYPVDFDNFANGSHDAPSPQSIRSIESFSYLCVHDGVTGKAFFTDFYGSMGHVVNCLIGGS